jgi:polyhydroxybutyrate depolymerase
MMVVGFDHRAEFHAVHCRECSNRRVDACGNFVEIWLKEPTGEVRGRCCQHAAMLNWVRRAVVAIVAATVILASTSATDTRPAAAACQVPAAGTYRLALTSGGIPRTALLHVPRGAPPGRDLPLVLAFHGAGGTGAGMEDYSGLTKLSDQRRFLVAYPDAYGPHRVWNLAGAPGAVPDDVAFTGDLIAQVDRRTCLDSSRIFATGVSNGGGMVARLGCDLSADLRAIAPVAGGYSTLPTCRPSKPVSVLEIHSMRDRVVPYWGRGPARAGDVIRYMRAWVRRDGCPRQVARRAIARGVVRLQWAPCAQGTAVSHLRFAGGGHEWPASASRQVWGFFASR